MASEADAIAAVEEPATTTSLVDDLHALGLGDGDTVIVHSSLSALGWVVGGAQAVVEALLAAVGPAGTLAMPTQSGQLSDPKDWGDPPVPEHWWQTIRDEQPAFDTALTPTRGMGAIVECFRAHRAARRSDHPLLSFAAVGPGAEAIVADHAPGHGFGERSPLARLYDADAKVLLLGADHGSNTSLHLAEHRAEWTGKTTVEIGAPVIVDGDRRWVTYDELDIDETDFPAIGDAFAATGGERTGPVGQATARLSSQRAIVTFAVEWMEQHRPASLEAGETSPAPGGKP